jgi:hypothetical protein
MAVADAERNKTRGGAGAAADLDNAQARTKRKGVDDRCEPPGQGIRHKRST